MADLILNFKTQGLSDTQRDLDSFKSAALEANTEVLQAWLAAKDTRQKTLDDIQRIEAKAGLERLAQERAILSQLKAERKAAAKEEADWAALQARASADAAKAAAREESAAAKQAASDYISFWKNALKEKEAAEKAAQASLESRNASAGGLGPLGIVSKTPAPEENGGFFNTLNAGLINASSALSIYSQIESAIRQIGSAYMDCIEQAAKWEQLQVGLQNLIGANASKVSNDLYQIAKAPGIEMEGAEKAFLKLSALGETAVQAERTITDYANTVARSGGGSLQFDRVIEQLSQMLTNGKIMQQDVKWMKESMPELTVLMEKAFGTSSIEALRKMGVTASDFNEKILEQMELLPKAGETLRSDLENTQTAWSQFKAALVDTEWTKSFLNDVTIKIERLQHLMTGNKSQQARDQYRSDITEQLTLQRDRTRNNSANTLSNMFTPGFMQKAPSGGMSDADIRKSVDAKMKAYDDAFGKVSFSMDNTDDLDKGVLKAQSDRIAKAASAKKGPKAASANESYQKQLDKWLNTQQMEIDAQTKYNNTISKLETEGVDASIAKAIAERDKLVDEAKKKYESQIDYAKITKAELAKLKKEEAEAVYAALVKGEAGVTKAQQEADKKDNEAHKKALAERLADEDAARKARIAADKHNDEQLKKDTSSYNKEVEQYSSFSAGQFQDLKMPSNSLDGLKEIEKEYDDLVAKINDNTILKNNEDQKTAILKAALQKRYDLEVAYAAKETEVGLNGASSYFGALADLYKSAERNNDTTYKVLFGIEKGFAIASATVNIAAAAAQAMADWSEMSAFAKVAAAGEIMAAGAGLITTIAGTAYAGVYANGGDIPAGSYGIAGETGQPEIIQGPAHVTSVKDTAALLGSKAPVVNIHNYAGASVSTSQGQDGSIQVIIDAVEKKLSSGIMAGGSTLDTAFRRTYGMKRG